MEWPLEQAIHFLKYLTINRGKITLSKVPSNYIFQNQHKSLHVLKGTLYSLISLQKKKRDIVSFLKDGQGYYTYLYLYV